MFKSAKELFRIADEKKIAIGAFNTNNLEVAQAIVAAGEKYNAPVLIQTSPKAIEYAGLKPLFDMIKDLIDHSSAPLAIHLDHAKDFSTCNDCLKVGYRSLMFDGSTLSFAENVSITKKVVETAHKLGAFVEAEIGVVGKGEEGKENIVAKYSDPDQAAEFVRLTGCDSLAISIGNIHGAPVGEKLNIELLKKIRQKVSIPLVLHGASGASHADITAAIQNGIRKVNIDTQLRQAFKKSLEENVDNPKKDFRDYLGLAREDVQTVVEEYIKLFNHLS